MIFSGVENLRDPFVVRQGKMYYLYGTGIHDCKQPWEDTVWTCYVNESGKLDGQWKMTENSVYEILFMKFRRAQSRTFGHRRFMNIRVLTI